MVTVLFNNGAKTFKPDQVDQWGLSDYNSLIYYLESWIIKRNSNLDMFYKYKVKNFSRKLANNFCLVENNT